MSYYRKAKTIKAETIDDEEEVDGSHQTLRFRNPMSQSMPENDLRRSSADSVTLDK